MAEVTRYGGQMHLPQKLKQFNPWNFIRLFFDWKFVYSKNKILICIMIHSFSDRQIRDIDQDNQTSYLQPQVIYYCPQSQRQSISIRYFCSESISIRYFLMESVSIRYFLTESISIIYFCSESISIRYFQKYLNKILSHGKCLNKILSNGKYLNKKLSHWKYLNNNYMQLLN